MIQRGDTYIYSTTMSVFLWRINKTSACIFRPHPDTDSGNIRTAFRNYPDSI